MLSQKERELLIRTQEKLHNAKETAEIFRVSVRTVYETIHKYKETGTTELRTSQRGRKSKLIPPHQRDFACERDIYIKRSFLLLRR